MTTPALGLVHVDTAGAPGERWWVRGLVVRQARERALELVDVLELHDDQYANTQVVLRLARLARERAAGVLVTHGVHDDLATSLAEDLGLRHVPLPEVPRARDRHRGP